MTWRIYLSIGDGSSFFSFHKGDLIELDQENGESVMNSGRYVGKCSRTGKAGDFPTECVYVLPTITRPPTEILVSCHNNGWTVSYSSIELNWLDTISAIKICKWCKYYETLPVDSVMYEKKLVGKWKVQTSDDKNITWERTYKLQHLMRRWCLSNKWQLLMFMHFAFHVTLNVLSHSICYL